MSHLLCCVRCTRTILSVLNIISFLFGFSILGLGIYIKLNGNFDAIVVAYYISQILGEETMQWIGTTMIISGASTACIAAFGCLGAIYQNRVFLYTYSLFLTLIILLEFAAVIIILRLHNDLWQSYDAGFEQVFQRAYRNNQTETIQIIEQFEKEFKCCGVNSYTDYMKPDYKIPLSCYQNQIPQGLLFNQGCAEAVVIWLWKELPIIAGVLGSIVVIELFGIISSLVLGVTIYHSSNTDIYQQL